MRKLRPTVSVGSFFVKQYARSDKGCCNQLGLFQYIWVHRVLVEDGSQVRSFDRVSWCGASGVQEEKSCYFFEKCYCVPVGFAGKFTALSQWLLTLDSRN